MPLATAILTASVVLSTLGLGGCRAPAAETWDADSSSGRADRRIQASFAQGRFTAELPFGDGGVLCADVLRVVNDRRKRVVEVDVEFFNRSDRALSFRVGDVTLWDGRSVLAGATLPDDVEAPPLRPFTRQRARFTFALAQPVDACILPMRIVDVHPIGRDLHLELRIPGPAIAEPPR